MVSAAWSTGTDAAGIWAVRNFGNQNGPSSYGWHTQGAASSSSYDRNSEETMLAVVNRLFSAACP